MIQDHLGESTAEQAMKTLLATFGFSLGGAVAAALFGHGHQPTRAAPAPAPVQAAVPANAQVLLADLALYAYANSPGNSTPVSLYQVTQDWDGGATWNCAKSVAGSCTSSWSTAGGSFNGSAISTTTIPGTTGWFHWFPTQLVQNWVNGTSNQGMILKETTENVDDVINFDSSYSSDSTLCSAMTWLFLSPTAAVLQTNFSVSPFLMSLRRATQHRGDSCT